MAITQKEIARRVGVSQQLVASALNGNGRVGVTTRRKVLHEAKRAGYRPNQAARALITRRTNLVALWLPQLASPYCAYIAQELLHLARAAEYDLIILSGDNKHTGAQATYMLKWPVDGIIALGAESTFLQHLNKETGCEAIVNMGAHPDIKTAKRDAVYVELLPAAREAMDALLAGGCRRVALMGVQNLMQPGEARYNAYRDAIRETHQEPEYVNVVPQERQREAAKQALLKHVQQHGCPDALFCCNDEEATGAYRALRELGLAIPDDVAVVGCDGGEDGSDLTPALSTLEIPVERMCELAWQVLQRRIEKPELSPQHEKLFARFVRSGSLR